jgi:hypothetical protein
MTVLNRALRFAFNMLPRVILPVAAVALVVGALPTDQPRSPERPTVDIVWADPADHASTWDTYRWADVYTCARVLPNYPDDDPCVYDPDPVGSPVPIEPDSEPVQRRYLPDGTDIRATLVPVGWSFTPPPADDNHAPRDGMPAPYGGWSDVTPDADTQAEPREDDPEASFDCRRHGNGVCGPGNRQGHAAGCYVRSGQRAGELIRPWGPAMAADPHYRPDGCGTRTAKDRAVDAAWAEGRNGQLCAAVRTGTGVVCWFTHDPRPGIADGPAWVPPAVTA